MSHTQDGAQKWQEGGTRDRVLHDPALDGLARDFDASAAVHLSLRLSLSLSLRQLCACDAIARLKRERGGERRNSRREDGARSAPHGGAVGAVWLLRVKGCRSEEREVSSRSVVAAPLLLSSSSSSFPQQQQHDCRHRHVARRPVILSSSRLRLPQPTVSSASVTMSWGQELWVCVWVRGPSAYAQLPLYVCVSE